MASAAPVYSIRRQVGNILKTQAQTASRNVVHLCAEWEWKVTVYTLVFPDCVGHPAIPAYQDDVHLGGFQCTIDGKRRQNGLLAVLPKQPRSADSMRLLISSNSGKVRRLINALAYAPFPPSESDELRITVKAILEDYRSTLDYLARDIQSVCERRQGAGKLYFPIAGAKVVKRDFETRLHREFPGLSRLSPELYAYLIKIQGFSGEMWLSNLGDVVNRMKHHELLGWEEVESESIVVHHDGVGVRIGALGLRSLEILKGGSLNLVSAAGVVREVRGPERIEVATTRLANADPEVKIDRHRLKTFGIVGTGHSLVGLLGEIDTGVRRACTKVSQLLKP
jgi:hypothetical protein